MHLRACLLACFVVTAEGAHNLRSPIESSISADKEALFELALQLHDNPETAYKEVFAHQYISDFVERVLQERNVSFLIERSYKGVETAFSVQVESEDNNSTTMPPATVVICAEYDALPIYEQDPSRAHGHACAHNLIAEAAVGAFLAVAQRINDGDLRGRVVLLGTPAEEFGGGKVELLQRGAFDGADAAIMVHGSPYDQVKPPLALFGGVRQFVFAAFPPSAAVEASTCTYEQVEQLKQRLSSPKQRVIAFLREGQREGDSVGYPVEYMVIVDNFDDFQRISAEIERIARECAKTSNSDVTEKVLDHIYREMNHNDELATAYRRHYEADGEAQWDEEHPLRAASDIGTVSHRVAAIQPLFRLSDTAESENVTFHTDEMKTLARSEEAQRHTLRATLALALTAADVLHNDDGVLDAIRKRFPPLVNGEPICAVDEWQRGSSKCKEEKSFIASGTASLMCGFSLLVACVLVSCRSWIGSGSGVA